MEITTSTAIVEVTCRLRREIMKYLVKIMALVLIFAAIILSGCNKAKKDDKSKLLLLLSGGGTFSADGVTFKMVYVPGGKTFPTGVADGATAYVADAFWIGETEVTYELWNKVRTWAIDAARIPNQYTFANDGVSGPTNQHPVTTINWRSAMVWCNALTEWYNAQRGTTYSCVYFTDFGRTTPRRSVNDTASVGITPGDQDNPYVKADAKGFRMITKDEWELSARWRNNATNTVDGYTGPYFTKGNSASEATTYHNDNTNGSGEPGKAANDLVAVYYQYWDGDSWELTGVTGTAAVKSKVNGANSLGLYDMSGNLWEWCFTTCTGTTRFIQGGSYLNIAEYLQVGFIGCTEPYQDTPNYGFRFARSAE